MLNRVVLMGRLTADPKLRQTQAGVSTASFSLAVSRTYNQEQTDFIPIAAWRSTAEFVSKYFHKGQLIAVEGAIRTRSYTDRDGNRRTAFEVAADQVYFAEFKSKNAQTEEQPSLGGGYGVIPEEYEELEDGYALPFEPMR